VKTLGKNKLEVVFSEPIVSTNLENNAGVFKVTPVGGGDLVVGVGGVSNPSGDNKTFELTLSGNLSVSALVEATVTYKNVADIEGNKLTTDSTLKFVATDDTTAPTATATVAAGNVVKVEFSETVSGATAAGVFELWKDGVKQTNTVTASATAGDTTGKKYDLSISGSGSLTGNYTIKLLAAKVTDASIRGMQNAAASFDVTLADIAAPAVATTGLTFQLKDGNADTKLDTLRVVVPFTKVMDATTATNLSNYIFNFGGADVQGSSLTGTAALSADGKSVVFTITGTPLTGSETTTLTVAGSNLTNLSSPTVKVLTVKDAAGNTLVATDINATKTLVPYVANAATLTTVKATGKRTIEIKSATPIDSINPNDIRFYNGTNVGQTLLVSSVSFSADKKTATLTLNRDLTTDAKYNVDESGAGSASALSMATISTTAIVNNLGQHVAPSTITNSGDTITPATVYAVTDLIAPALSSVTKSAADTIDVVFNEQLTLGSLVGLAGDLVVTLGDGTVLNPATGDYVVTDANTTDNKFEVKVLKNGVVGQTVSVKLTSGRYVTDAATALNVANVFDTTTSTTATVADTLSEQVAPTAPTVAAVTAAATTVTGTAEAGSTVTVKEGITVLGSAVVAANGSFSVTITAQTAGDVLSVTATDAAGNVSTATSVTVAP
jgi:trimeric autotransporter adhesin